MAEYRQYVKGKYLIGKLFKALELDRPVKRIVLTVDVNEPIEAEVTFYVEQKHADAIANTVDSDDLREKVWAD